MQSMSQVRSNEQLGSNLCVDLTGYDTDDSLQICSDSMARASKDIVSSNAVLCNEKEDEESICSGCSQCSEPICSDCCMDDLSSTPNVPEVNSCEVTQINSDTLNASKDSKANNVLDKVEDTFGSLMKLCQNLAELAQTKVDDINCGEVLSTNMLLGDMLCSAGKELKEAVNICLNVLVT